MRFSWTDDKLNVLKKMHADGATVAEITLRVSAKNTRAVTDKLREIGLGPGLQTLTPGFFWTEDKTAQLLKLHGEGHSCSAIGRVLGCSRNAVIGKIHRMGLSHSRTVVYKSSPQRARPVKPSQRERLVKAKTATRREQVAEMRAEPLPPRQETDIARKRLVDLEPGDCRFPVGDPGTSNFGFCAAPAVVGTKYCKHHFVRCFQPPPVRNGRPFVIYERPFVAIEKETDKV